MSDPESIIDAQVQHLLNVVEEHRAARYEEIQDQARNDAHAIVSKAHKDARRRMHDDNVETREKANRHLASTEAQLQTEKRLARQQSDEKNLQASWKLLSESLDRQWQQPDTRKQWVDNLISQAMATLVSPHWRIEHPADWPEEELIALQMQLHEQFNHAPELEPAADISSGLRLFAEGTCVDGTADGLMHERTRIEALILAAIHQHDDADHV